jgi:hypothetical protein
MDADPDKALTRRPASGWLRPPLSGRAPPGDWIPPEGRFLMLPVEVLGRQLTARQWRTLLALALFARRDGYCFVRRERLAKAARLHKSSLSTSVTELERLGWVVRVRRHRRCNVYYLRNPLLGGSTPAPPPEATAPVAATTATPSDPRDNNGDEFP